MDYMTPQQIADKLGVNVVTVYKWLQEGKMKGFKVGSLWRVRPEDYKKFVEGGARHDI